ncbi:hypothetical protein GCM10022219_09650 [Microbacterium oryzae]|uniref:Uncharacterized protein n=1 Tax=Microbacterium oryzae TaxID=743009 RepID=A0A6I6DPZ2_9MICO|nr:hypothetical protein [Microbacterium oryzae]QGU27025.1 hypothetical protein D7D94_04615 [Microbacterium oryzae]
MDVTPAAVEVRIDRLTLEGFGRIDVAAVRTAFDAGLERRIGAGRMTFIESDRPALALAVTWDGPLDAAALGDALAASVYEGVLR